jgi:hypothetical protein
MHEWKREPACYVHSTNLIRPSTFLYHIYFADFLLLINSLNSSLLLLFASLNCFFYEQLYCRLCLVMTALQQKCCQQFYSQTMKPADILYLVSFALETQEVSGKGCHPRFSGLYVEVSEL